MDKAGRRIRKIVAASAVLFVNIATSIVGVVAWFQSIDKVELTTGMFQIDNKSVELENATLLKFDYRMMSLGNLETYDYLQPSTGKVSRYQYNKVTGTYGYNATYKGTTAESCTALYDCYLNYDYESQKSYLMVLVDVPTRYFHNTGVYSGATPSANAKIWQDVDVMNLYDPADMIINHDLQSLHCNAIYELKISLSNYQNVKFSLEAIKKDEVTLEGTDIALSTCVDFNVFTSDQLRDDYTIGQELVYGPHTDTIEGVTKPTEFYPDYKKDNSGNALEFLDEDLEEPYYKISHLAMISDKDNFYSQETQSNRVEICTDMSAPTATEQGQKYAYIYINVNYAVDQLEKYAKDISTSTITAKYDFSFKFSFDEDTGN